MDTQRQNLVTELLAENERLRVSQQALREEINRLHGKTILPMALQKDELSVENGRLREYLSEIAKAKGPFSLDPGGHAANCVRAMQKLAQDALKGLPFPGEPWE
jgi:hypothetical protein